MVWSAGSLLLTLAGEGDKIEELISIDPADVERISELESTAGKVRQRYLSVHDPE